MRYPVGKLISVCLLLLAIALPARADVFDRKMLASYSQENPRRLFDHPTIGCYLQELLSEEDYAKLKANMEIMSINNDREKNGAYVFWGGLRGMFRFGEGMVVVHPDGRLWVGLLADRKIRYYTNVARDFRRLPTSIRSWRKEVDSPKVLFASTSARAKKANGACRGTKKQ